MKKSYQELYFKYKSKYLKLKEILGGSGIDSNQRSYSYDNIVSSVLTFLNRNSQIFNISSLKDTSILENGNTYDGLKVILNDETSNNVMYFFYNEQLPNNFDLRINQTNYSNLFTDYASICELMHLSLYDFDNEKYKEFNILNLYLELFLEIINGELQQYKFKIETFKESKIGDYEGYKIILERQSDERKFVFNFFYKPELSIKVEDNNIEPFEIFGSNSIKTILGVIQSKIIDIINNDLN